MILFRIFICLLALVPFVSCSDEGSSSVSGQGDFYGDALESYYVNVALEPSFVPDTVYVTFLDTMLQGIRTVIAGPSQKSVWNSYYMTEPVDRQASYIRIDVVRSADWLGNGEKMVLSRYAKADDHMPVINLYTAMAVKMIDHLMKEDALTYDSAAAKAYANIDDFFGIEGVRYESENFSFTERSVLPYVYCRYFVSDSVFYGDFRELVDAIDAGAWGDTLFRVRAADELVRSYDINGWKQGVRGIDLPFPAYEFQDFWEVAYGMEQCTVEKVGDSLVNGNRRSEFYDSVFVCDRPHDSWEIGGAHWRLIAPEERKFGPCMYGDSVIVEEDSVYYQCGKSGWEKAEDMAVVIDRLYRECNALRLDEIYVFRGTPYMCQSYIYVDSTYALMGYLTRTRGYVWTDDEAVIDSVYPGGILDSVLGIKD